MLSRVTQDVSRVTQLIVKSSVKMWSTGGQNGKQCQYPCHKNIMDNMKRKKDMILKGEPHPHLRSEGVQ